MHPLCPFPPPSQVNNGDSLQSVVADFPFLSGSNGFPYRTHSLLHVSLQDLPLLPPSSLLSSPIPPPSISHGHPPQTTEALPYTHPFTLQVF